MDEPILAGFLANLAADLAAGVINALTRKAREQFEPPPYRQALGRCYQAATAALLPEDQQSQEMIRPVLQTFFAQAEVQKELAALLRGRELDRELLVDLFEKAGAQTPAGYDFESRLADFVETFLQAAAGETLLVNRLQIDLLRQANAGLLNLVTDVAAIRRAVEQAKPGSGGLAVEGSLQARDIVTGIQHIVNIYGAGGGQAAEADYQAALERYLDWLREAMGRVTLRGILKRSGQPAIELPLADIYVPLAAEALPEARRQLKQNLKAAPDAALAAPPIETITMAGLLAQGKRLMVIGAPGCGKTTILQHIAWTLAEALRTGRPELAQARLGLNGDLPLPLYVPLSLYADHRRRFARDRDPRRRQLATFISHYMIERQAGLNLPEDFFATLLNQGRHVILLLDGLDEVPHETERNRVSQAVKDLTYGRPQARAVVTSRTQAYQGWAVLGDDFRLVRTLPLEPEQVAAMIRQAYRAIYPAEVEKDERERLAANLINGIEQLETDRAARLGQSEENRLVTTPLMVRMLLIVHVNRRRLPDQRAELYTEVVDTLLTSAHHPDQAVAEQLEKLGGDWRSRRDMLQYLAYQMHSRGQEAGREIQERALITLLQDYLVERRYKSPDMAESLVVDFVASSRDRAGLLEERSGRYRFSHLSFQEFLTARYLVEVWRDLARIVDFVETENHAADTWWREPILLAIGYLNVNTPDVAIELVHALAHLAAESPPQTMTALAETELAAVAFLEWGGAEITRRNLANRLAGLLTNPDLPDASPLLRAAAGRALARLGDPRPGLAVQPIPAANEGETETLLPDLSWAEVPAGPFLLGANADEKDAWDDERPQHSLELPTFCITRYPITNAQFAPFVDAGGYEQPHWWTEAGWQWRRGAGPDLSQIPQKDLREIYEKNLALRPAPRRSRPFFWDEAPWNLPNHPVVGLAWYEVLAYCAWLDAQLRQGAGQPGLAGHHPLMRSLPEQMAALLTGGQWQLRLPTEPEWEKAAGWDPAAHRKRVYAWGDTWQENWANVAQNIGRTSAVGIFPTDVSAYGLFDITGNVADWTLSAWGSFDYTKPGFRYPFTEARPQPGTGQREGSDTPGFRTLRGGAWINNQRYARVSYRLINQPDFFHLNIGFRIVVAPVL